MEHPLPPLESLTAFRAFRDRLDGVLSEAWGQYQSQMQCKAGCFSCCKNNFRISLIEACEVKTAVAQLPTQRQQQIQENLQATESPYCPLLVEGQCAIYNSRPVLCRIFGYPVSDGTTIATCELNFTDSREGDFTAQCFDGKTLGQALQTISRLYLMETGQLAMAEDEALPMVRIAEILTQPPV